MFGSECLLTWTSWFNSGGGTGAKRSLHSWDEGTVGLDLTLAKPVSMISYAPSEKPSLFKLGTVMRDLPTQLGSGEKGSKQ